MKTGLVCPEHLSHIEFTDETRTGLYIEVRSTSQGQGTFWYRFKDDSNRTARIKIGRTTDVTLQQAKDQVAILRAKKQLGQDIAGEERKRKQSITWDELFCSWYLPHAKQHLRSWGNLEEMHRLRISDQFGNKKLNQITKYQIQAFHASLKDQGLSPATADHHLKLIRQALNLAVEWDLLKVNPAAKIRLFNHDNKEERLMSDSELQRLMAVLDRDGKKGRNARLAVKFLLMTGARVNEALHAKWSDIDRKNRTWQIQATNSKSKRRRSVPLNDAAISVLDTLESEGKSEWVFTSCRDDGLQRLTTINKVWGRLRKAADLEHVRLHDLRHMQASMLINSGHSLYVVQKVLGHSSADVSSRYSHLSTHTLQDAANSVGAYLDKALEKKS
jgi:integrase